MTRPRQGWYRDGDLWRWQRSGESVGAGYSFGGIERGDLPRTWYWHASGCGWRASGTAPSLARARLHVEAASLEFGRLARWPPSAKVLS